MPNLQTVYNEVKVALKLAVNVLPGNTAEEKAATLKAFVEAPVNNELAALGVSDFFKGFADKLLDLLIDAEVKAFFTTTEVAV